MTEDEAKKKWCPLVRYDNGDYINRPAEFNKPFCIGSACMAWRWHPLMADAAFLAAVKKAENDPQEKRTHAQAAAYVKDNRAEFGLPTKPFDGYCGLAGVPQ